MDRASTLESHWKIGPCVNATVAADPDATREFENFVKMPIVVNQAGIADDGRCSR